MKKKNEQLKDDQKLVKPSENIDNHSDEIDINELQPQAPIVSQELMDHFIRFYEYHPAQRLSRNLRSLVLEFLMYDGSAEAEYLRDLVIDLDGLYMLLDAMEDEATNQKNSN